MNPILVESKRADLVESVYRGAFAAVNEKGELIDSIGEINSLFFPRSALKPLQVMGLMVSGAANAYNITPEEVALACASHNGEEIHRNLVWHWLTRIGVKVDDLACGAHTPMGRDAAKELFRLGNKPTRLHSACSGKHAGFLTLTKFRKHDIHGYADLSHPTQQEVARYMMDFVEADLLKNPTGIDGCQAPVLSLTLQQFAYGMARLTKPKGLPESMQEATRRVITSMRSHPILLAGEDRICTQVTAGCDGDVILKMGAEGVFSGCLPRKGIGFALKIDDGNTKASEIAIASILQKRLKLKHPILLQWSEQTLKNWNKVKVGHIHSTDAI